MLIDTLSPRVNRRERRLLRRLVAAGAVVPERAHPLPTLGYTTSDWILRLEGEGLLHRAADDRYYVDQGAYSRFRRRRRVRLAFALLAGSAALLGIILLWHGVGSELERTDGPRATGLPVIGAAPELAFGMPDSIGGASAELGRVLRLASAGFAVGDWDGHRILVFDSLGVLQRIIGRDGSGPGEFRAPSLIQAFSGDSLLVWDPSLRRITWLDARTGLGHSVTVSSAQLYGGAPIVGLLADGRMVAKDERPLGAGSGSKAVRGTALLLLDRAGERTGRSIDSLAVEVGDARGYRFFQPRLETATDGSRIFAGASTQWSIVILGPDGNRLGSLSRPWTPLVVTDGDKAAIRASISRPDMALGFLDDDRFDPTVPAFGRIIPITDGAIWVLDYAAPSQAPDSASLFDHDGRWLGTLALPPRFRPTDAGQDFIAGLGTRDDGDLEVRMYALRWPAGGRQGP
jgi:hypothetical protein